MSKGEEVRGEMELVAMTLEFGQLTGRWVALRPDAKRLHPVVLSVGIVIRVKHRTLGCVRSSLTGQVWSAKTCFGPLL